MKPDLKAEKKTKNEIKINKQNSTTCKILVEHSSYKGIERLSVRETGTKLCFILTK